MQKIKIGLAGFGMSAQVFHLPFLRLDNRYHVTKVFERKDNQAQKVLPQVKTVRFFEDLLDEEVDVIIITTPNQTHFELAKQALLAGKHVVVEKPMCATSAEALALSYLAKEKGLLLTAYQNRRWDSAPLTAKKLQENGLLGEIVDAEFRFERYSNGLNKKIWKETGEVGVGLVYDLGSHLLDMAVNIFGMPSEIYADIRYQHQGAISDDNFYIALYYLSGLKVSLIGSKYAREPLPFMTLHGKKGSYIKQDEDNQEALLISGREPKDNWNQESEEQWGWLNTETEGKVIRQKIKSVRGYYGAFYDNLYDALTKGDDLAVDPFQVSQVLKLLEKAYESAKEGRKIKL